ncbi:MAG TPA: START domain-containing protein [Deltaproteobacteria bacterium]|nr:START domain-containing protein [Deltaproteobacteria bacterium]HOI06260.1 START domain-containing protein [Deltaproteobacteria bacterium]
MKRVAPYLLIFCALSLVPLNAGDEWVLVKESDGIRSFRNTSPEPGPISWKAEGDVDAPLEALRELVLDFPAAPQWHWQCRECRLIRHDTGRRNFVFYFAIQGEWPMAPRDYVAYLRVVPSPKDEFNCEIRAFRNSSEEIVPLKSDHVRMTGVKASIRLTRIDQAKTRVEYTYASDPAGKVPLFLVGRVFAQIPFMSIKGMRDLMAGTGRYHGPAGALGEP